MHASPAVRANPICEPPPFRHEHNTALHQRKHEVSTSMRGLPLRSSIRLSFRTITVADSVRSRQVVHPVGDARARRGAAVDWRAVSPARRARCDLSKSLHIYCSKKSRRAIAIAPRLSCAFASLLACFAAPRTEIESTNVKLDLRVPLRCLRPNQLQTRLELIW